ncbi:MAG: extracellular solute-binding protein [Lachnospiraceae bacterium]|nr:extracellular solute-binding protein [Lachnospiraceae bacterium]
MKKRVLALVMSTAMIASVLTACGGNGDSPAQDTNNAAADSNASADNNATADSSASADNSGAGEQTMDFGSGEIKIWVPDAVTGVTETLCNSFFEEHPEMNGYTVSIEPMGEGDAAGNVITDVEAAPDLYAFAQDQMARLVTAGALTTINGDYATFVQESNDAGAAAAAKVGSEVYAFPLTSDNGYFMYYDKSVITDPTSLEQIIADCEAAGKNFYFDTGSWYQTAFFFATGCELSFETDEKGNFTSIKNTYASENGLKAIKAIRTMSESKCYMDGSSVGDAVNWAAIVDGTWDSSAAKDVLGDNYACAPLPKFTVDGETFQLGGFGGFKLLGVKPQAEAGKLVVCLELAKYLSDTDAQLTRFNEVGWGPSNLTAQQDPAVQADEALSALGEQLQYTIPQGQYPNDYWSEADALGETICGGNFKGYTDEQLMAELEAFASKMDALVQ